MLKILKTRNDLLCLLLLYARVKELWLKNHLTYFYLTVTQSILNASNMDLLKAIKEVSHGNNIWSCVQSAF